MSSASRSELRGSAAKTLSIGGGSFKGSSLFWAYRETAAQSTRLKIIAILIYRGYCRAKPAGKQGRQRGQPLKASLSG
jgi:hypothetical protein